MDDYEEQPIFREPQCLISTNERTGRLQVESCVLDQLRTLNGPLVVVAIAGIYRTGKSYLMNRLAGKSSGFSLGSTIQSKTKGLWIWVCGHPQRVGANLVLIDTEGLGDAEKGDPRHDESIITLATLLSSTLVYNYLGAISEDIITNLNFVATVTKIIKGNTKNGSNGQFIEMPFFILALRDFFLELEVNGQQVTADQYLEHILSSSQTRSLESNTLRKTILENFTRRKCFTFDRPTKTAKLKQLDNLQECDLNEDFLKDSHSFTTFVYNHCPPMRLPCGDITGSMYASLVSEYVGALRDGQLPSIQNIYEILVNKENRKVMEMATQKFEQEMETIMIEPLDQFGLDCALANALLSGSTIVEMKLFADDNGATSRKFDERTKELCDKYRKKNDDFSIRESRKMLSTLGYAIKSKLEQGHYDVVGGDAHYRRDVSDMEMAYSKCINLGVKKKSVWQEYLEEVENINQVLVALEGGLHDAELKKQAAEAERIEAEQRAGEERRKRERIERERKKREENEKNFKDSLRLQHELQLEEYRTAMEQETDNNIRVIQGAMAEEHEENLELLQMQKAIWDSRVTAHRENADEPLEFNDQELNEW